MHLIVTDHQVSYNGSPVIQLDLPDPVARPVMDAIARRLQACGYQVIDRRQPPVRLCARCRQRPPVSNRAKYCLDCQLVTQRENKLRYCGSL
jgi:hypothetical protein